MMERLTNRIAELARERVAAVAKGLEEAARDELPEAAVSAEGSDVVIEGKAAIRRLLIEAALQGLILALRSIRR